MFMNLRNLCFFGLAVAIAFGATVTVADEPPPFGADPISLDRASRSVCCSRTMSMRWTWNSGLVRGAVEIWDHIEDVPEPSALLLLTLGGLTLGLIRRRRG